MNVRRYKKDIGNLVKKGEALYFSLVFKYAPEKAKELKRESKLSEKEIREKLPSFSEKYQSWYSEALECVQQLLPSRTDDFVNYYRQARNRKEGAITYENYTIADCLNGLYITRGWDKEKVVGPDAAIPKFRQQLKIIESLEGRFESSLFDIRTLVQADLFDSELDVAEELAKKGFLLAGGAVAGVVLEGHLATVCDQHGVKVLKKKPAIADYNNALKNANVIDTPTWRNIQFLTDIRNLCDHKKKREPKPEEIEDLISGVKKIAKTVF